MRQLLVLLGFLSAPAYGAADHFVCVFENEIAIRDNADVQVKRGKLEGAVFAGERFVVDRVTGNVRGFITNANADRITVLDRGSNVNSFHAYWTGTKIVSAPFFYLHILAFKQPRSPFLYVSSSSAHSGLCE